MNTFLFLYIHSFNCHINPYHDLHFKNKEAGSWRSHTDALSRNITRSRTGSWFQSSDSCDSLSALCNNILEQIMAVSVTWEEKQ